MSLQYKYENLSAALLPSHNKTDRNNFEIETVAILNKNMSWVNAIKNILHIPVKMFLKMCYIYQYK